MNVWTSWLVGDFLQSVRRFAGLGGGSSMPKRPSRALIDLGRTFQIDVFQGHLSAHPDDVDVLEALGHLLTKSGRIAEGLAADRHLVRLCPQSDVAHYNLACSLALSGDLDSALLSLRRALELGYREFSFILKDADLAALRGDPRFVALLGEFGGPGGSS